MRLRAATYRSWNRAGTTEVLPGGRQRLPVDIHHAGLGNVVVKQPGQQSEPLAE